MLNCTVDPNFDEESGENDLGSIKLLTSNFSNEIRPYSSLAAGSELPREFEIHSWSREDIGDFNTTIIKTELLDIETCRKKYAKSKSGLNILNRSEKGEIKSVICVDHEGE